MDFADKVLSLLINMTPAVPRLRQTSSSISSPLDPLLKSLKCDTCGETASSMSVNEFCVTCHRCAVANLMRDESDDRCRYCGKRGRDFGKPDPDVWLDMRQACLVCVNTDACGGPTKVLEQIHRIVCHIQGKTPIGSQVNLRAQGVAARTKEVEALQRGMPLPQGRAGTIIAVHTTGSEGAVYDVELDGGGGVLAGLAASAIRFKGQLLDIPYLVQD